MGIQLSCPNQHYLIFWVGTSIYLDACSSIINELILVEEKEEDENINKQTTTVTNCLVLVAPSHSTSSNFITIANCLEKIYQKYDCVAYREMSVAMSNDSTEVILLLILTEE